MRLIDQNLLRAVKTRNTSSVINLLEKGANINAIDDEGKTCLHYAVMLEKKNFANRFLDACPYNMDDFFSFESWANESTFNFSADKVNRPIDLDLVQHLIHAGANLQAVDKRGNAILHHAAEVTDCPRLIKLLLKSGAEIECKNELNFTPLLLAARANNLDAVDEFITAGADIETVCARGDNCLHLTKADVVLGKLLGSGDSEQRTRLLRSVDQYGLSPLHFALRYCKMDTLQQMIDAGAMIGPTHRSDSSDGDVHQIDERLWIGLLPCAARNKNFSVFKYILVKCIDRINDRDHEGFTALHRAVALPHDAKFAIKYMKLLLNSHADINTANMYRVRIVDTAIFLDFRDRLDLLLSHNPDINTDITDKQLPLGLAIVNNLDDCMKDVVRYIVVRESQGEFVSPKNYSLIKKNHKTKKFYKTCQDEMKLLKASAISGSITYHYILVNRGENYECSKNKSIIDAFCKDSALDKFPVYGEKLRNRFSELRSKGKLMDSASNGLAKLLKFKSTLPTVYSKILKYLNIFDLHNLRCV